jgi:hypothetical protein
VLLSRIAPAGCRFVVVRVSLVFLDSAGGWMRGTNVRRRRWSQAVTAAGLFPRALGDTTAYDFTLHELRYTAAGLTLDRYGHVVRIGHRGRRGGHQRSLTRSCGQNVVAQPIPA